MGVPVVIGGDNLPSQVGIGLTNLPNIVGGQWPPVPASLLGENFQTYLACLCASRNRQSGFKKGHHDFFCMKNVVECQKECFALET